MKSFTITTSGRSAMRRGPSISSPNLNGEPSSSTRRPNRPTFERPARTTQCPRQLAGSFGHARLAFVASLALVLFLFDRSPATAQADGTGPSRRSHPTRSGAANARLAVDVVKLKSGQTLRGTVARVESDGSITLAVEREWLRRANPALLAATEAEESRRGPPRSGNSVIASSKNLPKLPRSPRWRLFYASSENVSAACSRTRRPDRVNPHRLVLLRCHPGRPNPHGPSSCSSTCPKRKSPASHRPASRTNRSPGGAGTNGSPTSNRGMPTNWLAN